MYRFPNAGKSTLLSALSRTTPTIASYPCKSIVCVCVLVLYCHPIYSHAVTTIRPQLGILSHNTNQPIRIADLPGLVEGAHANVGMGHKFLRHIERTRLLLFVVDICGFQLSRKHQERDAWQTICLLLQELEEYQTGLSQRPSVLAINKMDKDGAQEELKQLEKEINSSECGVTFQGILPISALQRTGVDDLKVMLAKSVLT